MLRLPFRELGSGPWKGQGPASPLLRFNPQLSEVRGPGERGSFQLEAALEVNESRHKAIPLGSLLREAYSAINNGFVFTRRLST